MRYTTILLSTWMLFAVSACRTAPRVNAREPVTDPASAEVPSPASTPFDGIADARAAYLQGYREGYSSGFPGFASPPWMSVGERHDLTDPRTRGWRDGALAARLNAAARLRKEE